MLWQWLTIIGVMLAVFLRERDFTCGYIDKDLKPVLGMLLGSLLIMLIDIFLDDRVTIYAAMLGSALLFFGALLRIHSRKVLGRFFTYKLAVSGRHKLVQEEIYGVIRHPLYLALLLMWTGSAFIAGSVLGLAAVAGGLLPVLVWRIRNEEAMLAKQFGRKYQSYKQETYALAPGIW